MKVLHWPLCYITIYGAASLYRTEFSGSSDQREDLLHQSGINGVPYQYRSGTTAFTEQGAGHYTNDTIDWSRMQESNLRLMLPKHE